ncbi:MAG: carbohydrate ABC transporter permease [Treponema sp.]|jgi:putative aldouronate transport system permease protein|nr:carbohydrate ABC transporter permease [Treponema sp.]
MDDKTNAGQPRITFRQTGLETAFDITNYVIVTLFAAACIFPFIYVLGFSLTPYEDYLKNPLSLIPKRPTLQAYTQMLSMRLLQTGYLNTIIITVAGTALNLFLLCVSAYPLSKKKLKGRGVIMGLIIFTMFFGGGMIPNYALLRSLNMLDTYWALILPGAISAYNLILMRNFIAAIPDSLEESAIIDGANEITVLFKIILPLSIPAIFTFLLFHAVGHWNAYFDSIIYLRNRGLWPLMLVLRELIIEGGGLEGMDALSNDPTRLAQPFTLQMAAIIITVVPILLVYPFIQRYFMKGMLLGSVKG